MSPTPTLKSSGLPRYNNLGQSADVKKSIILKILNLLRFENGFEIRDLHHFASKNVPHTNSQIVRVTEIQLIRSNQLMIKNR